MDNILTSLRKKVESGTITMREAAIRLHKAGWTTSIDENETESLLYGINL